ncbi:MAG: recombinase zinc beta ribbon domain-containing protein, partial [Oscillibacter sp.]|nr:recombinase zinc beta ribbon domain-containing protein [Oscillibacter sp.]
AFSELLVCGECGSPYKRCTWARKGKKRIVWRCVSRLEFGKEFCHDSPTMDEDRLQKAVVKALNLFASDRTEIAGSVLSLASGAMSGGNTDEMSMEDLRQRVEELAAEQNALLDKVLADMDNPELNARLKEASDEKQAVLERIRAMEQRAEQDAMRESRMAEMREWMGERNPQFTKYSETLTRRMIEKITVRDEDTVSIRIRDTGDDILVHIDTDG